MIALDEKYIDGNIPEPYQWVQAMLDRFVSINYEAALEAIKLRTNDLNINYIHQQIVDIIRNNPPLKSVPSYFRDGRENYLWYSDFYDDTTKDVFHKQYGKFAPPTDEITSTNYTTELAKIDLPYFRELVDLVSLVKLKQEAERKTVAPKTAGSPTEKPALKRSYDPKLSKEQFSQLAKCIEQIKLFRRPVSVATLKKLFTGKLAEPLQVMKQLPLVYLFDQLREAKLIKKSWMTTAVENRDFISFRTEGLERRYGPEPHFLTMDQLKSRRSDSRRVYIDGGDEIEDAIEQMLIIRTI
jgi:hypothetical protein